MGNKGMQNMVACAEGVMESMYRRVKTEVQHYVTKLQNISGPQPYCIARRCTVYFISRY